MFSSLIIGKSFSAILNAASWPLLSPSKHIIGFEKNFQIKFVLIGLIIGLMIVNLGFYFLRKIINQKFSEKQILLYSKLCIPIIDDFQRIHKTGSVINHKNNKKYKITLEEES